MYKQTMHSFTYQSYANFVDKDNRTKIRYLHCTLGQTILRHMYNIYLCRYYKQLSNKTRTMLRSLNTLLQDLYTKMGHICDVALFFYLQCDITLNISIFRILEKLATAIAVLNWQ